MFSSPRSQAQPAYVSDQKFWTPDGTVNKLLATNGTLYLAGDFTYFGPRTGPAGLFNVANGEFLGSPPAINGTLYAIVPDTAGGWFIGGIFTRIGNLGITNLAHLKPDLSVDTQWNAQLIGTGVYALALHNGRLYVGGTFTSVRGTKVSGLAGLQASDASAVWVPAMSGSVYALKAWENALYIGGKFTSAGGSSRANLAAISLEDTALATAWNPGADQQVNAVEVADGLVYVGGQFTTAGTKPRNRLAAIDASTGVANTWIPNPNSIVRLLSLNSNSIYVAGDFTSIGGAARRGFAEISRSTGSALEFDAAVTGSGASVNLIKALARNGDSLYVGGAFTNVLGGAHKILAGVNLASSQELPTPLMSEFNGAASAAFGIYAMAIWEGQMLVGGSFHTMGGVERRRVAALSLATGEPLPWAPTFSGAVSALAYGSNCVYLGGSFTNVNGTNTVRSLVALDPITAEPTTFRFLGTNQTALPSVSSLVATPEALYVGGLFSIVGDQKRRFVAAVNPVTGAPLADFDAKLGGGNTGLTDLELAGSNLYLAGDFTTVNAKSVPRLAAVSAVDGAAVDWTPAPNKAVSDLMAWENRLYVGGQFTSIGGVAFRCFAVYNLLDHFLLGLDASLPTTANNITAISANPWNIYIAGSYTSIGGEFRQNLASLAALNGIARSWDPAPDQVPYAITLTPDHLFVGGPFRYLGRSPTNYLNGFLAAYKRAPSILAHHRLTTGNLHILASTSDRSEAVLQAASDLRLLNWQDIATNSEPGAVWSTEMPIEATGNKFFRVIARD